MATRALGMLQIILQSRTVEVGCCQNVLMFGVAVFKTPACAKKDRIVQFSEIHHITIVKARSGFRLGSSKRVLIELSYGTD